MQKLKIELSKKKSNGKDSTIYSVEIDGRVVVFGKAGSMFKKEIMDKVESFL